MLLGITEVFGHSADASDAQALRDRRDKFCPLRCAPCNKGSLKDPLGICSVGDNLRATVVCPARFLEGGRLFADAARLAFGPESRVAAVPEVRVLKVESNGRRDRKIGKIDFMLAKLDSGGAAEDFAVLEVQAVYLSGHSVKPGFKRFLRTGRLDAGLQRRPDFRSSAQKRLMPQLALKLPIFRR